MSAPPRPLVAVCTHHKTGTVWMAIVFGIIARECGLAFSKERQADLPARLDIWLDNHSRIDLPAMRARAAAEGRPLRVLHLIRDPRDVIISGAHYHTRTDEAWANRPRPRFGQRSYRETISALPSEHERLLFEMAEAGGETIRAMLAWRYGEPEVFEARYEELIVDRELVRFDAILRFLGFEGAELKTALAIVERKSLFGGLDAPAHVRSGQPGQWRRQFTPALAAAFEQRFPGAAERLGYAASVVAA